MPAAVALLVAYLLVALPNGAARDQLRPLDGDGGNSLMGAWEFEREFRDGDLHAAIAAIPLDGRPDVYAIDVAAPALFVPFADAGGHIYWDSSWVRTLLEVDTGAAAHRIEADGTWTLVDRSELPFATAVAQVYADCVVHDNPGFLVLRGAPCAGRAAELDRTWRELDSR